MNTPFSEIYDLFLQKITDFNLSETSDEKLEKMLYGYMISGISKLKKCRSNLSDRDYVNQTFNSALLDIEKEIIATQMVAEWLTPQINSVLFTKQFISTKDEKFYSQANHLEVLQKQRESMKNEARRLLRDYIYLCFNQSSE